MAKFHALLIDDNAQNLAVLDKMIVMQGGDCVQVQHPEQLAKLWDDLPPIDLVFLDLEMPAIDGYTLLKTIKAHLTDVPVIAFTVYLNEMQIAYEKGFDSFLGKPINAEKFPEQLARLLKGEPVWEDR